MSKAQFKPVDSSKSLPSVEEDVLKFWQENKIFEKSVENRKTKTPLNPPSQSGENNSYSFYDGPPFATGLPHYGHLVGSVIKDVIPRYWTMKGKYIPRKWGWDCHGLPIENIIEKEMGSKTKKEIEELGVEKFNNLCRSKVMDYADEWKKIITRLGRWADMDNPYKTMDKDFMESVWWTFKQLWDKDLIYYSYRSMHVCPRCETTLSQSEVSEGYKDVKDLSVIAKFELLNDVSNEEVVPLRGAEQSEVTGEVRPRHCDDTKTYILAWTTTPWTLPGNVALAVGKDIEYVLVAKLKLLENDSEFIEAIPNKKKFIDSYYYIAKNIFLEKTEKEQGSINFYKWVENGVLLGDFNLIKTIKGSALVGLKYKPLWDLYAGDENLENRENGWQVVDADFVTTDEGTGVVHIAPAFGEDDMALGKEKNLPFVQHVAMDGMVDEKVEALGGLNVKPIENPQSTDVEVIKYLAGKGLLFHKEKYAHSYPHCWRCDTPLINYATGSWFVAVTKIKENLLENAKDINWTPEHLKEGRFGKWLEGGRDWSISRQRFWASVMPIWKCQGTESKVESQKSNGGCGHTMVFGSIAELKDASGVEVDDLHKHVVDKITFSCNKCDGEMHRVPDVLDTWFDSGSMPYGQAHYPFDNKEKFEKSFPADFIAEGIDQTRAWFYYLHVIAGGIFKEKAFKNVITNGIVLAEDGQKMSKKLQNYPDPMEMVNKYGADPLKFYLAQSPVVNAQDLNFSEKDLAEIARGTFRMLWQSYSFFVMYANIDHWSSERSLAERSGALSKDSSERAKANILDRWLISELHQLIKAVDDEMENYHLMQATRKFAPFVDNLSNWYIRRSRKRFWKSENDGDKNEAYATLHYVLVELSKTIAPFAPYLADEIYKNLTNEESVHLVDYSVSDETLIDEEINKSMAEVREIIKVGLQLRARNQMKVRQPLSELIINNEKLDNELIEIIKEELNVKAVSVKNAQQEGHSSKRSVSDGKDKTSSLRDNKNSLENIAWSEDAKIGLNLEITSELKAEGQARELIRAIQQMRKEADYQLDNRIKISYDGLSDVFAKFGDLIAKETLADEVLSKKLPDFDLEKSIKINDEEIILQIIKGN